VIEALIAYIQDKGYKVDVFPSMLRLSKDMHGQRFTLNWAIDPIELSEVYGLPDHLYWLAHIQFAKFDQAERDYLAGGAA
jgi:hypothetical protein